MLLRMRIPREKGKNPDAQATSSTPKTELPRRDPGTGSLKTPQVIAVCKRKREATVSGVTQQGHHRTPGPRTEHPAQHRQQTGFNSHASPGLVVAAPSVCRVTKDAESESRSGRKGGR